jgi:CheY-like chemotaxis protein
MRMPGMDGLEVAERIRAEHVPVKPVILMLSSDDLGPQLARIRDAGLAAYLVKPITRKELFDAIAGVIEAEAPVLAASPAPRPMSRLAYARSLYWCPKIPQTIA